MPVQKYTKHNPYEAIPRASIDAITDASALALWVYLLAKPVDWVPRESQIREHFGWGHDRYRKAMTWLKDAGFAEWVVVRSESGRITSKHLHIYAETNGRQNQPQAKPTASVPDDIKNRDTLQNRKTEQNRQKEIPSIGGYSEKFEEFWMAYPYRRKEKPKAWAAWRIAGCEAIADDVIRKLQQQVLFDAQFIDGFAPYPERYLKNRKWEDEIDTRTSNKQASLEQRNSAAVQQWLAR